MTLLPRSSRPSPAAPRRLGLALLAGLALACHGDSGDDLAVADPGGDADGDGLTNLQEVEGWDIAVDLVGLGLAYAEVKHVTSDPDLADTDGDGLDDQVEFQLKTDPRRADTDQDGLTDLEELEVWQTEPNTVDSDGDARGPAGDLVPKAQLFDGNETRLLCDGDDPGTWCQHPGTSPTLEDTDGDGRTDHEEFDHPTRSPLLAEMPSAELAIVGEIDLSLDVEYAEELASVSSYGSTITHASLDSEVHSKTKTAGWSVEASATKSAGYESTFGPPDKESKKQSKTESKASGSTQGSITGSYSEETVESVVKTSVESLTREFNRFQSDSQVKTEVAKGGSIAVGIVVSNPSSVTYELEGFGLTVLQHRPELEDSGAEAFKTLAVLQPAFDTVTLAPGEVTEPILVSTDDVNVDQLESFLANPDALAFQPTAFSLSDASGVDFDFLVETTLPRTAIVEIDFGDGDARFHRVATNARRGPGGSYLGITVGEVLEGLLGMEFETADVTYEAEGGGAAVQAVLTSLDGHAGAAYGGVAVGQELHDFQLPGTTWLVRHEVFDEDLLPAAEVDFGDIVLHAQDELRLLRLVDADGDGLPASVEALYGLTDTGVDEDGDGLSDRREIEGWEVTLPDGLPQPLLEPDFPRHVTSNPLLVDTDGDGLSDAAEYGIDDTTGAPLPEALYLTDPTSGAPVGDPIRLDPTLADTDLDGIADGDEADGCHLYGARVVFVSVAGAGGHTGETWDDAMTLDEVDALLESTSDDLDCTNDLAEIWLRRGTYDGTTLAGSFALRRVVYGGFEGTETKREARDDDPFTNGTRLDPMPTFELRPGGGLDGLSLERSAGDGRVNALGIDGQGPMRLANLYVNASAGPQVEVPFVDFRLGPDVGEVVIEACTFRGARNHDAVDEGSTAQQKLDAFTFLSEGGAIRIAAPGHYSIRDSLFLDNRAATFGGALYVGPQGGGEVTVDVVGCTFEGNGSWFEGGAIWAGSKDGVTDVRLNVASSRFFGNLATHHGGALALHDAEGSVVNSRFSGNRADTTFPFKHPFSYAGVDVLTDPLLGGSDTRGSQRLGGAVANRGGDLVLTNCTLTKNALFLWNESAFTQAWLYGAAIAHLGEDGATRVQNSILWGNVFNALGAGATFVTLDNEERVQAASVERNGTAGWFPAVWPGFTVRDSTVESLGVSTGTSWSTEGNLATDPGLIGFVPFPDNVEVATLPFKDDVRLADGAAALDEGDGFVALDGAGEVLLTTEDSSWYPGPVDLDGNPRVQPGSEAALPQVDQGCYEFQGFAEEEQP